MENITTFYARKTNVFTLLAALLMITSAVARIIFFVGVDGNLGFRVITFRLILPLAANIMLVLMLLVEGGKRLFVTRGPITLFAVYFLDVLFNLRMYGLPGGITAVCVLLTLLQVVMYCMTMRGRIHSIIPALIAYLLFLAFACFDRSFINSFTYFIFDNTVYTIADVALYFGIVFMMLGFKRMPDFKPGDPYRQRVGDRKDGRLLRSLTPMDKVAPYIMVNRAGAANYIEDSVEITNAEKYIRNKRRDGLKHYGMMHLFIAAYVRTCAELPATNRFLSGQRVFQRYDVVVNMAIKKGLSSDEPETIIKVKFDRSDNADQVYEKFDSAVQAVKHPELDSNFDNLAKFINYIPGLLLKFTVWFLKLLDYFGALPQSLLDLSPFHGSMFITSMGSLGIPPVFHHLYDFGNVSQFCSYGAKRSERYVDEDGEDHIKKFIDFTWTTDDRVVDGYYYSLVLKRIKSYLLHPERLDEPVTIVEDIY